MIRGIVNLIRKLIILFGTYLILCGLYKEDIILNCIGWVLLLMILITYKDKDFKLNKECVPKYKKYYYRVVLDWEFVGVSLVMCVIMLIPIINVVFALGLYENILNKYAGKSLDDKFFKLKKYEIKEDE